MSRWSESVAVTRRRLVGAAVLIGLACGTGIYLGAVALDNVGDERTQRKQREGLTAAQVEEIAQRVVRLERPPPREIVARLREGLPLCRKDPTCVRSLRRIAQNVPGSTPPPAREPRVRRRGPRARTNPPPSSSRPPPPPSSTPDPPRPPQAPQRPDPPLVDPPPIDPDGPGGLPPIDLPPIDLRLPLIGLTTLAGS